MRFNVPTQHRDQVTGNKDNSLIGQCWQQQGFYY